MPIGGSFLCHPACHMDCLLVLESHISISTLTSKISPLSVSHCLWSSQGALQASTELRPWAFSGVQLCSVIVWYTDEQMKERMNEWSYTPKLQLWLRCHVSISTLPSSFPGLSSRLEMMPWRYLRYVWGGATRLLLRGIKATSLLS